MKRSINAVAAVVLLAALCLVMGGCGADHGGVDGSTTSRPTTVVTTAGVLASDSWGYTGATAALLTSPAKTQVVIEGHTLLEDPLHAVISGACPTSVSYSSDPTTLPAAARLSLPGTFVCYLSIAIGTVWTAQPALSVTVDVAPIPAGQTVNIYRYDSGTGTWGAPQAALVTSSGQVAFQVSPLTLYGSSSEGLTRVKNKNGTADGCAHFLCIGLAETNRPQLPVFLKLERNSSLER